MATRTKSSTIELSAAELSRERIAAALAALRESSLMLDTEASTLAGLEQRLKRGDATVDLHSLALKRQLVADIQTRIAGQTAVLKTARRAEVTEDPQLAEAVAPTLAKALGVDVEIATVKPVLSAADALPRAVLVQQAPHRHDASDGRLSGRLVLHYARTELHRPADEQTIDKALDQDQVRYSRFGPEGRYQTEDGVVVDRIVIEATGAWPAGLPVIANYGDSDQRLRSFGSGLATKIERMLFLPGSARTATARGVGSGRVGAQMSNVAIKAVDSTVSSDRTDQDGTRTVSGALNLTAWNTRYAGTKYSPSELIAGITRAVDKLDGTPSGVGRISSARVMSSQPLGSSGERLHGADCRIEVEFTSQVA